MKDEYITMVANARALLDAEACAPLLIITSPPWGVMDGCDHDIALEDGEVKVLTEHAQRQMYKHNKHTHTHGHGLCCTGGMHAHV